MKAYVFTQYGGPENQEIQELPTPEPGPSEVRIAVRAAGVNPIDWKIRQGFLREFLPRDLPAVLGGEAAGVVEAVGQDVDGFAVGDEVFGNTSSTSGAYAEQALLSAAATAKKPGGLPFTAAAVLPIAAATAYDGLAQLKLDAGATLLINGIGGGVGVVAAQLARDRDITVVGTASEDKRVLVESLGAILVPSGDGVAERVRQILPEGVDAILDLVGGDALRAVAELAGDRSRIVTAGDPGTAAEVGGVLIERDGTSTVLDAVVALVAQGKIDSHVGEVFPLDDAGSALAAVEAGHARGKVVIEIG
ncbi:NADP-dependent oxidoreductase [Pseudonocardia abyssalis]|jgi:NADPH:quinone reductase-like Zn-dependent oxidoreductase|uniref:NADP-dependent oxidoreductase n=3 Tax=Pseudonocardia abyssalis TaxID=2792008 RepID=A0ABS6UT89_9PSEU|nr:NADP-dependent oxidoreductase [Pseudonocardia abyssalis]MBW0135470.1 NADP-dependent oxidoreductase [Pseudonocardia abyssalis]